ncbi:MAG: recombinase family protein [Candidatus Odinarchaeota archaeon]
MKVAIYARVSTDIQAEEGYSIPAQINLLRNYAKTYNYTIFKIYQDAGISGKDIKGRPGLLSLLEDAEENKFDIVLIWKLSRLSRSLLDLLSVVDRLNGNQIGLVSYSEHFDTSTPIGKMLLQLLGSIAEFERNTIIENVKMGLSERFKQGLSKGSIPFGYIHVNKKAVINKEQAKVIKFIFDEYLKSGDGECVTYLANYLNSKGYRTRTGHKWTRQYVRELLKNKFYAGYVRTGVKTHGKHNGIQQILGQHEAIVNLEQWEDVQKKIELNRYPCIRNPENNSILTGLVKCPYCHGNMYALNTKKKYINKQGEEKIYDIRIYRCTDRHGCKGFYLSAKKVEPIVIEKLKKLKNKKYINALMKDAKKETKKVKKISNIKMIETELKETIKLRDKYYTLFDTGKVEVEQFADKINKILKRIEELENFKEIELKTNIEIKDKNDIYNDMKIFWNVYEEATNSERKEILRGIIKEVNLNENKTVKNIVTYFGFTITI